MKIRKSRQRERILELLRSTEIHPTAIWLYDRLKDEFFNCSLGTVYRNLNILLEQGLIKKIAFGSTFDRFEANITDHYHFICDKCNSIIDLNIPIDKELNKIITKKTNYNIKRHRVEFFGLCEKCKD
ncbi:MAG: transcriptional repressor [Spirochaetes bacterium]|nr:transcriptional repressor [Spirochaetota bacterium]